jgi:hypothetical protein
MNGASIFHSAFHTAFSHGAPPLGWALINPLQDLESERLDLIADWLPISPFSTAQHGWAAPLVMRSSIPIGAPWPGFSPLTIILCSAIAISTALAHLELHIRQSSSPGGASRFPPNWSYMPFKPHHNSPLPKLDSNLIDITNRAKRHWNSISPFRQAVIIQKYKEHLQLVCAVDELGVTAFVGSDEMGCLVDDIEPMFYCIRIA